jgi:hypothetical protein
MNCALLDRNFEVPILRRDLFRVIPFEIVGGPVVEIHSLPEWIISWIKGAAIYVELV